MIPTRTSKPPEIREPPRRAIASVALAIASCVGLGAAAEETLVVVVHGPEDTALARRICAEVEALDVTVAQIVRPRETPPVELGELARAAGAHAAIRAETTSGRVEVWADDPRSDRVIYRSSIIADGAADEIALEAVELLRASLLTVRVTEPAAVTPESPAPEPEVKAPPAEDDAAEPAGRLSVELGPMVTAATFDAPPTVNMLVGAHLQVYELLGVELVGVTPMVRTVIEEQEGRAAVHFGMVGGGLRLGFGKPEGRWLPSGAVGCAAALFQLTARADSPFVAHDELVASPAPYGRIALALSVHERVRVRAEVLAAWTLPRTVVQIAGREVAVLGAPLLAGALEVELLVF